ncbi:MAG TPA: acyl-CoA dehydrogenase family protein [Bacillota bacterium]
MDFQLNDEQLALQEGIRDLMKNFPDSYWRERDRTGTFPEEFFQAMAEHGYLGIAMPEEYGGAGKGITEAALILEEVAAAGAGMSGASAVHINIFGVNPLVKHGTPEQKRKYLPKIIRGELKVAFGVTEPDAGLETPRIKTFAERRNGRWVINGTKVWTTTAQVASKVLLIARTTPYEDVEKKTEGMTLFFADLDRRYVDIHEIDKLGRAAVDSNILHISGLEVDDSDVVGEVGKGFYHLLDGLNPERILIAAEAIGTGKAALRKAIAYARERVVFGRPIGQNQGIQFPLADCYADLELAELMMLKAAWKYDSGLPCGAEANMAKLKGAEAGFKAADQALRTFGGYGYAKDYHVERLWREVQLCRIAPVTRELILAYLGHQVLGLPRSY